MKRDGSEFGPHDLAAMQRAVELARAAWEQYGEVPVGAVISDGLNIIAEAFNLRETLGDPTAHAERLALTLAGRRRGDWRLDRLTLYVTLEPCVMCAGAILAARIPRLVYGAADPKAGAVRSLYRLTEDYRLNHRCQVQPGLLAAESEALLKSFFQNRRKFG